MRTRKLMGIPVLHIQAGVQLGRVCGFCVDPDSRRVAALLVKTKGLKWGRRVLAVSDVFGLGSDAVTVRDAECLKKLKDAEGVRELFRNGVDVLQTDAITERGDCIGVVDDFSINQTGQITELVIAGSGRRRLGSQRRILPGRYVRALGADAVVVSEAAPAYLAQEGQDDLPGESAGRGGGSKPLWLAVGERLKASGQQVEDWGKRLRGKTTGLFGAGRESGAQEEPLGGDAEAWPQGSSSRQADTRRQGPAETGLEPSDTQSDAALEPDQMGDEGRNEREG